jgi:hypothetical protein
MENRVQTGEKEKLPLTCVYCRQAGTLDNPIEDEHVIPKTLFRGPLPQDIVVVPACRNCNREKSKDDSYLRDMLILDDQVSKHPDQQWHVEKIYRAAQRKQSRVAWLAATKAQLKPFITPGGIYLGDLWEIPLDEDRMTKIFSWIIRGLYYVLRQGERLPENYVSKVVRIKPGVDVNPILETFQKAKCNGPYTIGNGIFGCFFIFSEDDPGQTYWWMWFYSSIGFLITTKPPIKISIPPVYQRKSKKR